MTNSRIDAQSIYTKNYNSLLKVANTMLKTASDGSATPQDVLEVLDSVVDQLTELRSEVPGGSQAQPEEEMQTPPGQKEEPAVQGAKDSTEGKESVNEQNAAQLALRNKTYTMDDELKAKLASLQSRLDEAEAYKAAKEREEVAQIWSDLFPQHQAQQEFDRVVQSTEPLETWGIRIETAKQFATNSQVRPAKTQSVWIKTAKQIASPQVRFI